MQVSTAGRVGTTRRPITARALSSPGRLARAALCLLIGPVVLGGALAPHARAASAGALAAWAPAGHMIAAREYHTATLLPNGAVLIAGGANNNTVYASTE